MTLHIAVFTATRAEYGLLKPLLVLLNKDADLKLSLLVSGTHLSAAHGYTLDTIEKDGFSVAARVDLDLNDDSVTGLSHSMALALEGYTSVLKTHRPDALVVLGDRYEALMAGLACVLTHTPLVHVNGGETSQGAMDEVFRHSLSKMASLHCVSTQAHAQRVVQLGEHPDTVFNVGFLGADSIAQTPKLSRMELEKQFDIQLGEKNIVITFHPETLSDRSAPEQVREVLTALECLDENVHCVITGSNADTEGQQVNALLKNFVQQKPKRRFFVASLGQQGYYSLLALADAVVGNSSSGLLETPFFCCPALNIGDRQKGRSCAGNVLHVPLECSAIESGLKTVLGAAFKEQCQKSDNPFGGGAVAENMIEILKRHLPIRSLKKQFYDRVSA